MGRDLLTLLDRTAPQLETLVGDVVRCAETLRRRDPVDALPRARVAFLWDGMALRNRAAADLAVHALGVAAVDARSRIGGRETTADLAGYLDNWFDAIVVRSPDHDGTAALAAAAEASVVNAGTWSSHPTEVLTDLAYLAAEGLLDTGPRIAFVGPSSNVLASWLEAATRLPLTITQVTPARFAPSPEELAAYGAVPGFSTTTDLDAVEGADIVYTDCWWRVRDHVARRESLDAYRVTPAVVARAKPEAIVLHGPPVTVGLEIDADVVASDRYRVHEAKSYLLPVFVRVLTEAVAG